MKDKFERIRVIGFDADDTLWINETYFRDAEDKFTTLLEGYEAKNTSDQELFKMEMKNLGLYGYGIKGFMLSMIESAIDLSNGQISNKNLSKIIQLGKDMLEHPVHLLPGVSEVLSQLQRSHRLIVLTKGDLLDQERKLRKSGLEKHFHHVEVLHEKEEGNYSKLLNQLDIDPAEFVMVGNSLKSDVLPVIALGGQAVHIPFHTTWRHEEVGDHESENDYLTLSSISELPDYFKSSS